MGLVEFVLAGLCLNATCPTDPIEFSSSRKLLFQQLEEDIKRENLIITTLRNEILSGTQNVNDSLVGTGVAFALLNILQEKFNFNYTIILPKTNVWGSESTGILEMLRDNEANMSAAFLPVISLYSNDITYSPSLDTGEWVVLMKRPKESATGSGLLAPFTLPVWLLILLSLCVVGPVIYFIIYIQAKLCKDEGNKVFPLPSCVWFVYGALLKQGTTLNPVTDSSRLLFATWWIFITILTAFYTANLTAFLTLSKFTLPISKPEDIGAKRSKWVTTKGNALEDSLSIKNDSNLLSLAEVLGPPQGFIDRDDKFILNQYVHRSDMMFIREKPIVEYVMYDDYKEKTRAGIKEAERCTYVITKFSVTSFYRAFAYARDFKYKPLFDSAIQYLVESGIIKFKLREELPDTEICPLNLGSKERQLRNADLLMTYEIVGGGFAISALIFIIEVILKRSTSKKFRQAATPRPFGVNNKNAGKKNLFQINLNNNFEKFRDLQKQSKFITPPPSYNTLFNPSGNHPNIKRKKINGREYWVYDTAEGGHRMVPLRTPSALLFQFTN